MKRREINPWLFVSKNVTVKQKYLLHLNCGGLVLNFCESDFRVLLEWGIDILYVV